MPQDLEEKMAYNLQPPPMSRDEEESAWAEFYDALQRGDMDYLERLLGFRPTERQWVDMREDAMFRSISSRLLYLAGWLAGRGQTDGQET